MAARPIWRGHLRLALVSCPIALTSVVRGSAGLHFHLINPASGHRIRMVTQDAETDQEVSRGDLIKGFEFEKDRYVLLDDEDFDQAKIDSSSTLTISKFVQLDSIDPIYFDTAYFVTPDGDAGQDVFVVLRDAIRKARTAALSRLVIARRERAVAIIPSGDGLVCHTLHQPQDLWDIAPLLQPVRDLKPEPDMVALAGQLIDRQNGRFQPEDTEDRYETRLREVINAKLKGEGIEPDATPEPDRGNVVDLMAALKASLREKDPKPNPKQAQKQAPAQDDKPKRRRKRA